MPAFSARATALVGLLFLATTNATTGQTALPFVVRDLYALPSSPGGYYNPGPLFDFNGTAYFAADSSVNGRELWRTNGTDAGTALVRDINPGNAGSNPDDFFTFRGQLYFIADDGAHGRELWRTDGTASGTRMVADLYPGVLPSNPTKFAAVGNTLYFNADNGHGNRLFYMFDGSTVTTLDNIGVCCLPSGSCSLIRGGDCAAGVWGGFGGSCTPSPCPQPLSVACCHADSSCTYAIPVDCAAQNGTSTAPNTVCSTTCPGIDLYTCCRSGGQCSILSGLACFNAGGSTRALSAGCTPDPCASTRQACCLPSGQCFMVGLEADCTSHAGTIQPVPYTCTTVGQFATYCAKPSFACCKTDGTCAVIDPAVCRANSGFIRDPNSTCAAAVCFAGATEYPFASQVKVYSTGSRALILQTIAGVPQIWTTNGTVAGTQPAVLLPGALDGTGAVPAFVARGRLHFLLDDGVHGPELWQSDGTAAGTALVKDIAPGTLGGFVNSSFGSLQFVESGAGLYFLGSDATRRPQLWVTDDTDAGTMMLTASTLGIAEPYDLTPAPGGLLFTARTMSDNRRRWWFTDGTPAGTHLVGPVAFTPTLRTGTFSHRIVFGNTILFDDDGASGELWSTDLTTGITRQIFPLPYNAAQPDPRMWQGLHPANFSLLNGHVFFSGDHQQTPTMLGNVLWTTDGTSDGTVVALHLDGGAPATWGEMAAGSGDDLFFSAPAPDVGYELFRTNGTVEGTTLIKDLNPGTASSSPSKLVYRNGLLMFAATVPGATQIVCRSDGTAAGTYPLGSLVAGESSGSQAGHFTVVGNQVLYYETTPATGLELWHTDGTAQNTGPVADIVPGSGNGCSPTGRSVAYNGVLYFAGTNGLYRSDGTAAGTVRILATSGGTVGALQPSPLGLFFTGQDNRLWITDGTAAGTHHVTENTAPFSVDALTPVGSTLYFTGQDSTHGRELWRTDGTAANTQLVVDLVAGTTGSFPASLTVYNGTLYFLSQGALYTTDGTAAGTHPVLAAGVFTQLPMNLALCGTRLIISGQVTNGRSDLWSCDPVAGTVTLLTTAASGYSIQNLVSAGSYLYFSRMQSSNFQSLNRTDGTPAGTIQIAPGEGWVQSASPSMFVGVGNDVYFSAIRPDVGMEIFHTAAPGTSIQVLADIYPGGTGSSPGAVTPFGSSLLFTALTQQHGIQLYISDGTAAGTHVVKLVNAAPPAVSPGIIMAAGERFFYTPVGNASLACSDGSSENTYWLGDFNMFSGAAPLKGCEMGGKLYFNGKISNFGVELCVSDGTLDGTHIVADLAPGVNDSGPAAIAAIGNRVFFSGANTPDGSGFDGPEPCVSDGTVAGTHRAGRISPNPGGSSYPSNFTDLNGLAIFVATNGGYGTELYRSDGTPAGTYLLKDILPGGESYPRDLAAANGFVFFSADDGVHGRELWRTDGTVTGTVMVKDICVGELTSNPTNITAAGDRVYFTAYTPETGVELWTSDGSATGTFMLFEIIPGPSSANIRSVTRAGNRIYFLATVPPHAPSLWSFDWGGSLAANFLCPADYNRVDGASVQDIFDFLNDWLSGASRADINGNGLFEVQDIFDFINLWLVGC